MAASMMLCAALRRVLLSSSCPRTGTQHVLLSSSCPRTGTQHVLRVSSSCPRTGTQRVLRVSSYGHVLSPPCPRTGTQRAADRLCNHNNYNNDDGDNCSSQTKWTSTAALGAMAFSLFNMFEEEDKRTDAQKQEDEIILLLKKAKLSMYRGQLQAASDLLHQAVALAHRTHNNQAIIYTYSLMANLAYVQGQLDNAEKLFKAAMSFMLSGGTPQDDNGVIEISLKLATIYAGQNKSDLANIGYRFCIDSLEAKLLKHKDLPEDELTEDAEALRKETRLLLGLCLDSRARYRASTRQLSTATLDYQHALLICGQEQGHTHPQTLVLMSDLATILDLQGRHDDALPLVTEAVELSRTAGHPDLHVLLGNLAGILLHTGRLDESLRAYKEALSLAEAAGDEEAVEQVHQGLSRLKKKRSQLKKKKTTTGEPQPSHEAEENPTQSV